MSDNAEKVVHDSKAEKKNKKRKGKKTCAATESGGGSNTLNHQDMLVVLKDELAEAKLNKDHKRAGELRTQIWVLTDIAAGIKTAIPETELNEIIESIQLKFHPPSPPSVAALPQDLPASSSASNPQSLVAGLPEEKKIRALRKKLEQIAGLKERKDKGEKLETNQVEKISSEGKIYEELKELEEILVASVAAIKL